MPLKAMVIAKRSPVKADGKKASRTRNTETRGKRESREPAVATDELSWSQFEEDDYIVFCFKEDGAFDVSKTGNSDTSSSSRPVSRKLNYGEGDKAVKRSNEEKLKGQARDIYLTNNDGNCTIFPPQKDEEGRAEVENINLDAESSNCREDIPDRRIMVPTESSDSNHSDVSNGSFAFPVLGWEWSGSPVQMPKSLQMRKQKARCVGFQCCRF